MVDISLYNTRKGAGNTTYPSVMSLIVSGQPTDKNPKDVDLGNL